MYLYNPHHIVLKRKVVHIADLALRETAILRRSLDDNVTIFALFLTQLIGLRDCDTEILCVVVISDIPVYVVHICTTHSS